MTGTAQRLGRRSRVAEDTGDGARRRVDQDIEPQDRAEPILRRRLCGETTGCVAHSSIVHEVPAPDPAGRRTRSVVRGDERADSR